MKAVILAGGLGTRLAEETQVKPKPMVEIGSKPILWHIMKIYSHWGINDFIFCLGYKGYSIKEYFANYFLHSSDVTFDLSINKMSIHRNCCEPWRVTLVDTGLNSMTGGRLKRVREFIQDEDFCFTYGDGVANVNVSEVIDFHKKHGALATMTGVQPPGRFGALEISGDRIMTFKEKPQGDHAWVNGGFFVLSPGVFDYIEDDNTVWEAEPLENLAREGQLHVYRHRGFWQCMDTLRDKISLDQQWLSGKAAWKLWDD